MGTTLNKAGLEALWIQAGGRPAAANMAAAIALAESSGRQDAVNYNTNGTVDRGYWQINSVHGALSTDEPLANAKAAVEISNNGTDWSPWTTYTSGAYVPYLGQQPGVSNYTPAGGGGATSSTSSSSSSYGGLGGFLLKAVLTVGLVGAGMALAGVGARGVLSNTRSSS